MAESRSLEGSSPRFSDPPNFGAAASLMGAVVCFDHPAEGSHPVGLALISGWVAGVAERVRFFVDDHEIDVTGHCARPDVSQSFPGLEARGFSFWLDLGRLGPRRTPGLRVEARFDDRTVGTHDFRPRPADGRAPLVYFIHCPKTAGTALREAVARATGGAVLSVYDEVDALPPHLLPGLSEAALDPFDVAFGHFGYGAHAALTQRSFTYLAMLREPTDFVLSSYLFAKYVRAEMRDCATFADCIADPELHEILFNRFCRLFSGWTLEAARADERGLLAAAIRAIETDFAFVGLHERFDESVRRIGRVLGVPLHPGRVNETPASVEGLLMDMRRAREASVPLVRADLALYDFIRRRFFGYPPLEAAAPCAEEHS